MTLHREKEMRSSSAPRPMFKPVLLPPDSSNAILSKSTVIKDETGKPLPAVEVFSKSIQCLKDHLEKMLVKQNIDVKDSEIQWIITVPAIWEEGAKVFMREAAEQAGINAKQLSIALEPEAASLYCQYLPVEKFSSGGQVGFADAQPGTTYMIVDLGGGTADITVHEKISAGKLKEVLKASGGPWGGTAVDRAFISLLSDIVGGPVFGTFMKEHTGDYIEMMHEFEIVKRSVSLTSTDNFKIKLPFSLNETCNSVVKKDFASLIIEAKKNGQISVVGDKIKFDATLMQSLFKQATNNIVSHMRQIIESSPIGRRIQLILMVGGFSESPYVQEVIKAEFNAQNGIQVLIPHEAGLAVSKGAVVFGKHPENITSRILRFTYGVEVVRDFEENNHEEKYKFTNKDGIVMCDQLFSKFIEEGTEVTTGHTITKSYTTSIKWQDSYALPVYISPDTDPMYTDEDDCQLIGEVNVKIPHPSEKPHELTVTYVFGDTYLHLSAADETSNEPCEITFSLPE